MHKEILDRINYLNTEVDSCTCTLEADLPSRLILSITYQHNLYGWKTSVTIILHIDKVTGELILNAENPPVANLFNEFSKYFWEKAKAATNPRNAGTNKYGGGTNG
jgi:hypothetical protein